MEEDLMFRTKIRFVLYLMLICLTASVVPASAQHFKQITGTPLSQIAAGRKEVWGLYNSQIYRFNPNTESFDPIPGALTQIAVGGGTLMQTDEVWGINNGEVYRFNFNTNTFDSVPGGPKPCKFCIVVSFSQIAVGAGYEDNCHPYEVWVLNSLGNPYRYNYCTSQLENISSPGFAQIAVGSAGDVWGLWEGPYAYGYISPIAYQYFPTPSFGLWDMCTCAAFGGSGPPWQQIAVGVNDVWAVDSNGAIWFWAPQNILGSITNTSPPPGPSGSAGFATKIASGGDGAWIIYNNYSADVQGGRIARYEFQNFGFIDVPLPAEADAAVQIAVGSGAGVWVLDASDEVFTFVRP
jgi:Tectonin domain